MWVVKLTVKVMGLDLVLYCKFVDHFGLTHSGKAEHLLLHNSSLFSPQRCPLLVGALQIKNPKITGLPFIALEIQYICMLHSGASSKTWLLCILHVPGFGGRAHCQKYISYYLVLWEFPDSHSQQNFVKVNKLGGCVRCLGQFV